MNLEELFVRAVIAGVPYSQAQLIDRALDNVKQTGLYLTAVMEWNGLNPARKLWNDFKHHFVAVYELRLGSGPTAGAAGYYDAVAALSNNDSLGSISGSLAQMQMANNANTRVITDNMSAITNKTTGLRQALLAT